MKSIHITTQDYQRLQKLLAAAENFDARNRGDLESLKEELNRAEMVAPTDVPKDVITMNSTAELEDLDTQEKVVFTLVFPEDADPDQSKISILAPIGAGMIGYRVGDEFSWKVPHGVRRLKVSQVLYQPEAAGHFHL
jgi:regulator of nucleoside diphosphate kinase